MRLKHLIAALAVAVIAPMIPGVSQAAEFKPAVVFDMGGTALVATVTTGLIVDVHRGQHIAGTLDGVTEDRGRTYTARIAAVTPITP